MLGGVIIWKAIRLKNLQSWEDLVIDLNSEGLTVFEAKSETGKSVFISALRLGLNYDKYDADIRKNIVRNWWDYSGDRDNGSLSIITDEGSAVIFTFSLTEVCTTIVYKDKRVRNIYGPADEEVLRILSLVKCGNSSRILNIIDNEDGMLWVNTSFEENDAFLTMYLYHDDLEFRQEKAVEKIGELKEAIKLSEYRCNQLELNLNRLVYLDNISYYDMILEESNHANLLLEALEKIKTILFGMRDCSIKNTYNLEVGHLEGVLADLKSDTYLYESLNNCNCIDMVPTIPYNVMDNLELYLRSIGIVSKNLGEMNHLVQFKVASEELLESSIIAIDLLNTLNVVLSTVRKINEIESCKNVLEDVECFNTSIDILRGLSTISNALGDINDIRYLKVLTEIDIPTTIYINQLNILLELLKDCISNFEDIELLDKERGEINKEYTEFVKLNKTCPVCSSLLEETL